MRSDREYFKRTFFGGSSFLHRDIWEHHNGPIPSGHHVHHKDGDCGNNEIDNLECISAKEHVREHWTEERSDAQRSHLESIRPLAKEWHASRKGLEWHKEHGHNVWEKREERESTCQQCDIKFTHKTISNKCKSAWRRDQGLDDVDRTCLSCESVFRVNKYSKQGTCSRPCANRVRWGRTKGVRPKR